MPDNQTLLEKIESLEQKVQDLTEARAKERQELLAIREQEYERFLDPIMDVLTSGDKMQSDFEHLIKSMQKDELLIAMADANNPNSSVLGFQFSEIVIKIAKQIFLNDLSTEDRPRFEKALVDATDNSLLKVLAQSNPIGILVSRVVEKVVGFVKSVRIKGKNVVSVQRAFTKQKIKKFIKELDKYVRFYDSLLLTSREYKSSVQQLTNRKNELVVRLDNYYEKFLQTLEVTATSGSKLIKQVNKKLKPELVEGTPDYLAVMNTAENRKAHQIAIKFPELQNDIRQLEVDYYQILSRYFGHYLKDLKRARKFSTTTNIDLEELIERIEECIVKTEKDIKNGSVGS